MMFRRFEKIGSIPARTWCALGAGAAMVLVAALVHVLNGQVMQAQLRQMQNQAMQAALARCAAGHLGAARSMCIAQLHAAPAPEFTQLAQIELRADVHQVQPGVFAGQALPPGPGRLKDPEVRGLSATTYAR